jgi:hypothetical protein
MLGRLLWAPWQPAVPGLLMGTLLMLLGGAREGGAAGALPSRGAQMLAGVPYVIHLDMNRFTELAVNANHSAALEAELLEAGVCPSRCAKLRAVQDQHFEAKMQGDGGMIFEAGGLDFVVWPELVLPTTLHLSRRADWTAISQLHIHLRAIYLAFLSGIDYVVIMESNADLSGAHDCGGYSVAEMVAALPQDSWRVLQLTYDLSSMSKALDMQSRFRQGYHIKARDPCGHDMVLGGTAAYAIHRRGMVDVLAEVWPGFPQGTEALARQFLHDPRKSLTAHHGGDHDPSIPPPIGSPYAYNTYAACPLPLTAGFLRAFSEAPPEGVFDLRLTTSAAAIDAVLYTRHDAYVSTCPLLPPRPPSQPRLWSGYLMELFQESGARQRAGGKGSKRQPPAIDPFVPTPPPPPATSGDLPAGLITYLFVNPSIDLIKDPRDEAPFAELIEEYCRAAPPSRAFACTHQLATLVRLHKRVCGAAPLPSPDAPDGHTQFLFLYDSRLVKVSWPSNVAGRGPADLESFCEMMDDAGTTRECYNLTMSAKYIAAATAVDLSVLKRDAGAPGPAPVVRYPYPLGVFWHVATAGPLWDGIAGDQYHAMLHAGLDRVADFVDVVLVGGQTLPIDHPRFRLLPAGDDLLVYEFPTLGRLEAYCRKHPEAAVLYMHNKGSSMAVNSIESFLPSLAWRHLMEHFVVTRYHECLAALERGFDTCGVNLKPLPRRHYSGNFWWARCRFVNTLPSVTSLDQTDRFAAEYWLSHAPAWRPKVCFNVTYDMYWRQPASKDLYEGSAGCAGGDPEAEFSPVNVLH